MGTLKRRRCGGGGELESVATPATNGLLCNAEAPDSFNFSPKSSKLMILKDWWLVKSDPGSNGRRLGVAGVSSRGNGGIRSFASAAILKRHDAVTLETADGITVLIHGQLNKYRTHQNGFPSEVFDHFVIGFPYYWEEFTALSFDGEQPPIPSSAYKTPRKTNSRKEQVQNTAERTGPITRSRSAAAIAISRTSDPVSGSRSTIPVTRSRTSDPVTVSRSTGPVTRSRTSSPITGSPSTGPVTRRNRTSCPVTGSRSTGPVTRRSRTSDPITGSRSTGPVTRSQSRLALKSG